MTTASRILRPRTTAAAAALLLGLSLAACGGGDSGDSDDTVDDTPSSRTTEKPTTEATSEATETSPSGDVPSEDELTAALLTAADVPAGFTQSPDDDNADDTSLDGTCLADVGEFSDALGFEPDSESSIEFVAERQATQTSVTSKIEAYADPTAVAPAFAEFTDTLQSCTSVKTTDEDGVAYELQIGYDDSVDLPGAEDQLRVEMTGNITAGAESYALTYRFVVGLAGPYVSIVGTYAIGDDTTGALDAIDDLAALQAGRVAELG